ncbi:MAG: DUF4271 domain-containing protein [Bacteroidaceae bacterium]|nr:DUF4271 domain-containing protein [Bacteroidaceae bacterium]
MQQDTIVAVTVQPESMDTTAIDSQSYVSISRVDSLLSDSAQVVYVDSLLSDSLLLDSLYLDSIYRDSLAQVQQVDTVAVEPEPSGMVGEPWSSSLHRSSSVIGLSLLAVFLMLFIVGQTHRYLGERFSNFFFPKGMGRNDDGLYKNHPLLKPAILLLLASECSLLFMEYNSGITRVVVCLLVSIAFLVLRLVQYAFVNTVFFNRKMRERWRENYMLLMLMESVMLLPITLVYVYAGINPEIAYICIAIILLFVKILLLFKTFSVFFVKIAGTLHLIVYFCALEIVPALIWWVFLGWIIQLVTV